jgi:multidrug resistance efflux pump
MPEGSQLKLRDEAVAHQRGRTEADEPLKVDHPRAWIALAAMGVLVAALAVFGFTGKLPQKLEATGVIEQAGGGVTVQSVHEGQVQRVVVGPGDRIERGAPIAELRKADGSLTVVRTPFPGHVLKLFTGPGKVIRVGSDLFTMERSDVGASALVAYAFLKADDVGSVAPGMRVDVILLSAPSFGAVRGRLVSVESAPSPAADIANLVSDDALADQFTRDGDPFVARIALEPDKRNRSGVRWAKGNGPPFALTPDTPMTAEIRQGEEHPIDLVFGGG